MTNSHKIVIGLLLLTVWVAPRPVIAQDSGENHSAASGDEAAVKAAVEGFLIALGNGDLEQVKTMFLPEANIASIAIKNGESDIYTASAEQYLSQREGGNSRKFQEPVREFSVNISQGLLAFVRADATVYYEGVASHHTNDFFILMKDQDVWKILSGSYTTLPLVEDH